MLFLIGTAATILSGLRHGVSAQILDAQVFIAGHTGIKGSSVANTKVGLQ